MSIYEASLLTTNAEWAETSWYPCVVLLSLVLNLLEPSRNWWTSASGIHTRHSSYYIRTVRGDNKDPLTQFMKDQGIPNEPCVMKPDTTTVFSFPVKSPEGAVVRDDVSAMEQLKTWLIYQRHWCEHKPSVTVSVKEEEWMEVGAFVYEHFDEMSGVSFLPYDGGTYQQAPYQECGKSDYEELKSLSCPRLLTGLVFRSMNKRTTHLVCRPWLAPVIQL